MNRVDLLKKLVEGDKSVSEQDIKKLERDLVWLDLLFQRAKDHVYQLNKVCFLVRNEDETSIIWKAALEKKHYYSSFCEALYMFFHEADE